MPGHTPVPEFADHWAVALIDPGDFTPAYDLALAEGLLAAGHRVRLVGSHGSPEAARPAYRVDHFYRAMGHPSLAALPRPVVRTLKGACHGADFWRLNTGALGSFVPDVYHLQWLPLPILDLGGIGWLRRQAPVVITLHDSAPYNGDGTWLMRLGYLAATRAADLVIVHTEAARVQLLELGFAPERVHLRPHGLLHQPPPLVRSSERVGRLRLLQFGKIRHYKGVDVLLQAVAGLSETERRSLEVQIVGRPYLDTKPLLAFVRAQGLEDVVRFRFEFVPEAEIHALCGGADALVFPYRHIDASGVAMTAVAHGRPFVASAIGDFVERFVDGREARLVPPGDATALRDVLRSWLGDRTGLERLAVGMGLHRDAVPSWHEIGAMTGASYATARRAWIERRQPRSITPRRALGPSHD